MVERPTFGKCRRNKIKEKSAPCNSLEGMDDLREAEVLNNKVKTDTFNLDQIATEPILVFSRIKDRKLNQAVFAMVKTALETNKDPFTGNELGHIPMGLPLVKKIIKFCETGEVLPTYKKRHILMDGQTVHIISYLKSCGVVCAKAKADSAMVGHISDFCDKLLKGVEPCK